MNPSIDFSKIMKIYFGIVLCFIVHVFLTLEGFCSFKIKEGFLKRKPCVKFVLRILEFSDGIQCFFDFDIVNGMRNKPSFVATWW